jgi:peptidyl-prolyl cis-trans isomerase D
MRVLAQSWIFKSLMVLLVISFAAWGIGDMFRGNPALRTVASVGEVDIPVQELETRFQLGMAEIRGMLGPDITPAQARQMGLLDRTLNLIIQEIAFDLEANRLGIHVPREYIIQKIAEEPRFRTPDGKFNAELLRQLLARAGLSEEGFFQAETRSDARKIVVSSLTAGAQAPKIMIDTVYQARGAKRILEVLTLRNDAVKGVEAASEEQLKAYYTAHEGEFVAPEYRGLTIGKLSSAEITKDITVTDQELQEAYETRSSEFVIPETRDLVQIVLQDEEKAKSIAETATSLRNLAEAAKAKNLTPITMNKVEESAILPELAQDVLALKEGNVTKAVKSPMGWHVVQLKKIHAGGKRSFDEAKVDLQKTLQEERAGDMIAKTINQLDDALAGGKSLEDVADSLRLQLSRYASLDAKGLQPDGQPPKEALPATELVLPASASLNSGETSQVLDDGSGQYYVVRVDQITPSQTQPFDVVKEKVRTAWTEEQYYNKAAAAAEDMAKELREGKKATSFASMPGVSLRLSQPMSVLSEPDKELPPEIVPQVFHMKKGDVTTAARHGKQYIVRLNDIVPVDPAKPESSRLKIVADLQEKYPQNVLEQYMAYMETLFPTKIDIDFLNALKNQGG